MSDRDTSGAAPETAPMRDINPNDLHAIADTLPDDALDFEYGDTEDTSDAPNETPAPRREAPQEPQEGDGGQEPATEQEEDGSDAGEAAEGEQPQAEGEGEQEEQREPEKKPEPAAAFVEIDGHKIPIEEVRRGFMRQADYTRKTQAVAEKDRQIEALRTQTDAERGELQTILNVSLEVLKARMPQPPNKDMIRTDPMGYMEQSEAYNEAVDHVKQLLGAQQQLGQKQTAEQQQAEQRKQAEAAEREASEVESIRAAAQSVLKQHPTIFANESFDRLRSGVEKYSDKLCIDADAFAAIKDPRAFPVLDFAIKYLDLQAAKPAVEERIKAAPPIRAAVRQAPGTRNGEAQKRAMDRLRREGTIEAAAATLPDNLFD